MSHQSRLSQTHIPLGFPRVALPRLWKTASIPQALRQEFEAGENAVQRKLSAWGIVAGSILMLVYTVLDWFVVPDVIHLGVLLRIGVAIPLGIAVLVILRSSKRTLIQQQMGVGFVAWAYSLILVTIVASSDSPSAAIYMTGNNIALVFAAVVLRLPPRMAVVICLAMVGSTLVGVGLSSFASAEVALANLVTNLATALPALYANKLAHEDRKQRFLEVKTREVENAEKEAQNALLRSQKALLERLAAIDPLTDLANRRTFDALLNDAIADKSTRWVTLMLLDVDHFKSYNDHYGHMAGDQCLRAIGKALARAADRCTVCRIGGEEFALVASGMTPDTMEMLAHKIRLAVRRMQVPHAMSTTCDVVTMSVGVAVLPQSETLDAKSLMVAADNALYTAKRSGRNRVHLSDNRESDDMPSDDYMAVAI